MSAPEHPPPWRWTETNGRRWLMDANGRPVTTGRLIGDRIVDSHASELQRLAPEMEALLRILLDPKRPPTACLRTRPCGCEIHQGRRLLARIDEASRG